MALSRLETLAEIAVENFVMDKNVSIQVAILAANHVWLRDETKLKFVDHRWFKHSVVSLMVISSFWCAYWRAYIQRET